MAETAEHRTPVVRIAICHIREAYAHLAFYCSRLSHLFQRQFLKFHESLCRSHTVDKRRKKARHVEQRALDAVDELGESHEHADGDKSLLQLEKSPNECCEIGSRKPHIDKSLGKDGESGTALHLTAKYLLPTLEFVDHQSAALQHFDDHLMLHALLDDRLQGAVAVLYLTDYAAHLHEIETAQYEEDGRDDYQNKCKGGVHRVEIDERCHKLHHHNYSRGQNLGHETHYIAHVAE